MQGFSEEVTFTLSFKEKMKLLEYTKAKTASREGLRLMWAWKSDYLSEHFQLPLTERQLEPKSA